MENTEYNTVRKKMPAQPKAILKIYTKPSIRKFLKYIAEHERTTMSGFMVESSLIRAKEIYKDMKTTSNISYDENFNPIKINSEVKSR